VHHHGGAGEAIGKRARPSFTWRDLAYLLGGAALGIGLAICVEDYATENRGGVVKGKLATIAILLTLTLPVLGWLERSRRGGPDDPAGAGSSPEAGRRPRGGD
jgi:hypothetical protein